MTQTAQAISLPSAELEPQLLSREPERLSDRQLAQRALAWTIGGYGATQALRLAGNLALTRLLVPEAFGLMALVNVFMQGLQMFSDVGIGPNIVRHKHGEHPTFLNTAWTLQIIRGWLLWLAAAMLAWPVAAFYGQPELFPLIAVAGLGAVISGFNSTALHTLSRRLELGRLTIRDVATKSIGVVSMVVWAWVSPSVWALVGGGLIGALGHMLISHRLTPHRNKLAWDAQFKEELISFGRIVAISTAITFLAGQGERLILGKFLDIEALGVYSIAFFMARFGTAIVQQVMSRVLFPSLAKAMRESDAAAARVYRRTRMAVDGLALLSSAALIPLAPYIIAFLYDARYHDAGWMLQILAVQAAFDIMRTPASWLLIAAGLPRYSVWAGVSRVAILCVGLPLSLVYLDMRAALWVITLSSLPQLFIFAFGVGRRFPMLRMSEWISGSLVTVLILIFGLMATLY